jgi:hypothetical protein
MSGEQRSQKTPLCNPLQGKYSVSVKMHLHFAQRTLFQVFDKVKPLLVPLKLHREYCSGLPEGKIDYCTMASLAPKQLPK